MRRAKAVTSKRVAVIGAGWAGCAAAVELSLRGHQVTLLEAARMPGGRARALRQRPNDMPGAGGHADSVTVGCGADVVDLAGGAHDAGRAHAAGVVTPTIADDDWTRHLDNGQHILLGAYTETLRLMRAIGVDMKTGLLRLPLQMRYPPGSGGMDFIAPRLPAPLHLLVALLRTQGLARADKLALARFSSLARWIDWRLNQDCTVTQLLERFNQTDRLTLLLWRPLCLAALNTPPERASAQVFLNVLRDSLGARRAASDMLLPRTDLSLLFPQPALRFVERRGGRVHYGARVQSLSKSAGGWQLVLAGAGSGAAVEAVGPRANGSNTSLHRGMGAQGQDNGRALEAQFDAVVLATPVAETRRLLAPFAVAIAVAADTGRKGHTGHAGHSGHTAHAAQTPRTSDSRGSPQSAETVHPSALELANEPITTCYLRYAATVRLQLPFYALLDAPALEHWGQFVFDRGHLDAAQAGILAVVISASSEAVGLDHRTLGAAVARQMASAFNDAALAAPLHIRIVSEKRATFSCTPGLLRAATESGIDNLLLAGDHVASDYPATLEGAVRSGVNAARAIDQDR